VDAIESGAQVDVVYTDFSKAFDRVSHRCLVQKLNEMGVHSSMLSWIGSYLSNRKQYVKMSGSHSRLIDVASGVPQGSHLGPLLFILLLLFINDLESILKSSKCLMNADDLKVYIGLQLSLDALVSWCQRNRLHLNVKKCKTMSFYRKRNPIYFNYSINSTPLDRVTEMRDLGIFFDERMSFNKHIDIIVGKAYSMLGLMKRICYEFTDPLALRSVYFAYVGSHLE